MKINIIKDFHKRPYGRYYPEDGEGAGQRFRDTELLPKMRQAVKNGEELEVDMSGYNRYGSSFIDESFGGLIREGGLSYSQIKKTLKLKHDRLLSKYQKMVWDRLEKAAEDTDRF